MNDACCAPVNVDPEGRSTLEHTPVSFWSVDGVRAAIAAGSLLVAATGLGWADLGVWSDAASLAAVAVGASTFVPDAARRLVSPGRRLGVDTLMTIAVIGAVALGEVRDAAALTFLFSISEALESYAMARARAGLSSLLRMVPDRVTVIAEDGTAQEMPSGDVAPGQVILVRAGERVATDGVVRSGRSSLDLSVVTGETVPVPVTAGDEAPAGALNVDGALDIVVTRATDDSSLADVVRLVAAAQDRKGAAQHLADRVAAPLVPAVLVASALVAAVGSALGSPSVWIERALVLLVAASPCALAIAVPVTAIAAVGAATRRGALIKGGAALEGLGTVRTVALDKTGTLTRNATALTDVVTVDGYGRDDVVRAAAAVEARSSHPLATAIVAAAPAPLPDATDVVDLAGSGVEGVVDGVAVRVGRPGFLDPGPLQSTVDELQATGATTVIVELDSRAVGALALRDEIRPESREVVDALRRGHRDVVMLTGDQPCTAAAIAGLAGIATVHAALSPAGKADIIETLHGPVAMVGDGVNDAPALATATVGVAMGAKGSDVAIETAEVALMGDDLHGLVDVLDHARRARTIMLTNLALAIAVITVLAPLALAGAVGLTYVIATHEIAEIVVIANGVRAGKFTMNKTSTGGRSDVEQVLATAS
jgi:cation-transporting ATPase G